MNGQEDSSSLTNHVGDKQLNPGSKRLFKCVYNLMKMDVSGCIRMYRLSCWRFGGSGTKVLLDPHSTSRQIQTTLRVDTNKNAVSEFSLPPAEGTLCGWLLPIYRTGNIETTPELKVQGTRYKN